MNFTIKRCPSYEGYSASSDGRIFSHRRRKRNGNKGSSAFFDYEHFMEIKVHIGNNGYSKVSVTRDKKEGSGLVHRMIADAFHGPCPVGLQTRHLDGDKKNNSPYNLCYGTAKDNADDRQRHKGYNRGANHPSSKLTWAQVEKIRSLKSKGWANKRLAEKYGVTIHCIYGVVNFTRYRPWDK